MTLTIGNWIIIGIIFLIGLFISIANFATYEKGPGIIAIVVTLVICILLMFGLNWYNSNTADGIRHYRSYKSNLENGIERTIDIYDADMNLRYHYEGTVDVDDSGDYELFFDTQDGQRVIIHYGIQDLVVIQSKGKAN